MQRAMDWEMTLFDYKDTLHWVRELGWSDDDLRQVPVHEQATAGEDYLNLANFGGTALGVTERAQGGGTSGGTRNLRNLYVYKREVPQHLYARLEELCMRGGPSGFQDSGQFGERTELGDFPPPHTGPSQY
ncbi:MAG TPA: hypothetical protein VIN09_04470 [Chloroflexota bacterium]